MHYKELGYKDYGEFLAGPEWEQLHNYFYENCGPYRCGVCGVHRHLLLHKRTYDHLTLFSLKKRFFFVKPLIVRWLRKHFVWLCSNHNNLIHFYDNGARVPLEYNALVAREKVVINMHKSLWRRFIKLKPSEVLDFCGKCVVKIWRAYQV
jgi:hypothetical protein